MVTAQQPAQKRGPYRKTRQRRRDILDAALAVFAESGYRGGSLKDVAERVGLSEAGLLHHFGSKSELLIAVLEHRDELTRSSYPMEGRTGPEHLVNMITLAHRNAQSPGAVELFTLLKTEAILPDHPAHDFFADRAVRVEREIRAMLADLHDRGWLKAGVDIERTTLVTIALWDGLQIQWLSRRHSFSVAEALREHLECLLNRPFPPVPRLDASQ